MRAIILAAGKGERLGKVTEILPKPMIEHKGKPVIFHNVELCRRFGIVDLYINLHHLPERIVEYFGTGETLGVRITYSHEEDLLGTAGGVRRIAQRYWGVKSGEEQAETIERFFVIYGDNFSAYNLQSLIDKSLAIDALAVIGFHYREDTSTSGVAEFDDTYRIRRFIEKPRTGESDSHWVNAGIYLLKSDILDFIPEGVSDFGKDIFPRLLSEGIPIYGVCEDTHVRAFDTPEMLRKNRV